MLKRPISLAPIAVAEPVAQPQAEVVSLRPSSVVSLFGHGLLDSDQVAAAFTVRNLWEAHEALRQRENPLEKIDNQQSYRSPRIDQWHDARRELRRVRSLLGKHGFDLVIKVCAQGFHIRDMPFKKRRQRDTATDLLRIHLSMLACMWEERPPP